MTVADVDFVLRRGVFEIIVEQELRDRMREGKPLRLKMGFDPTRPDLHLGHAVALRKLRQLQELGHMVVLIVGDWTARIGDPSGQSEMRPMLGVEEINANAETYMRQFFRIVDRDRTEMVQQSEWFGRFGLEDVIKLTGRFTVAQMLAREDFAQRFAAHKPLGVHELLYPLLQGYDSVAIRSDVEFGGSDQKFNCLVGRDLQGMVGQRPQQVFLVPLLVGTDGRKMSKSYGNYIAFEDPPNEMYGKVMSIADSVMMEYFELLTDVPDEELAEFRRQLEDGSVNPMVIKHRLAAEIVAQFYGAEGAGSGEAHFRRVVQERQAPEEMPEFKKAADDDSVRYQPDTDDYLVILPRLLVDFGLCQSANEARRLVTQGGVKVNDEVLAGWVAPLPPVATIKVGRRKFARFIFTPPTSEEQAT